MNIVVGADHGGFKTKEAVKRALARQGHLIIDIGAFDDKSLDDYPDFAEMVAREVLKDKSGGTRGILVCGTGTGMAIAANKIKGIRASVAYDAYSARMARKDNDANILALRGRNFPQHKAIDVAKVFLRTPFSTVPRYARRVKKIDALERKR